MKWTRTAIKQAEGTGDCVACCAAMIAGTSVEEFKAWCGQEVGPYDDPTLMAYLLKHGIHVGTGFRLNPEAGAFDRIEYEWRFEGSPAYLGVKSRNYEHCEHGVFWNGVEVLDPDPKVLEALPLSDYAIVDVWPLHRFTPSEMANVAALMEVPETRTAAKRIQELEALVERLTSDEYYNHLMQGGAPEGWPTCRVCGCWEYNACEDGCSWVEPDLCSACVGKEGAE